MSYQINTQCDRCGICLEVCKAGAIVQTAQTFAIIAEKCKSCGACAARCPKGAIVLSENTGGSKSERPPVSPMPLDGRGLHGRHCRHRDHRHSHRFAGWIIRLVFPGKGRRRERTIETEGPRRPGRHDDRRSRPERHRGKKHSSTFHNCMRRSM